MKIRDKIQLVAVKAICQHDKNCYIDIAPRVGKSKIICDYINTLSNDTRILITVPRNPIIESWRKEREKWNVTNNNIKCINQRSLNKVSKDDYDLIIVDEVHTLSEAQIDLLKKLSIKLVGVSGSIGKKTTKKLKSNFKMKLAYQFTIEQAVKAKIISPFEINCVSLPLDRNDKYIPGGNKKNPFLTTEYGAYNYYTRQFNRFRVMAFNDAKYERIKMSFASKRADLIYNAKSKYELAKNILLVENERSLLFTARTKVADDFAKALNGLSYHSKIEENTLEMFSQDSSIDFLAVCEMVDMGITFPNLKLGMFHQLRSSEEAAIQKVMRMCNLEGKKKARIFITYFQDTVEDNWLSSALEMFDEKRINYYSYKQFMK